MTLPFMGITGSLDNLGPLATAAWHKIPFERSTPGDKFEVFIQGANHMSFITDETLVRQHVHRARPPSRLHQFRVAGFLDAYLKDDLRREKFLQSRCSGALQSRRRKTLAPLTIVQVRSLRSKIFGTGMIIQTFAHERTVRTSHANAQRPPKPVDAWHASRAR